MVFLKASGAVTITSHAFCLQLDECGLFEQDGTKHWLMVRAVALFRLDPDVSKQPCNYLSDWVRPSCSFACKVGHSCQVPKQGRSRMCTYTWYIYSNKPILPCKPQTSWHSGHTKASKPSGAGFLHCSRIVDQRRAGRQSGDTYSSILQGCAAGWRSTYSYCPPQTDPSPPPLAHLNGILVKVLMWFQHHLPCTPNV